MHPKKICLTCLAFWVICLAATYYGNAILLLATPFGACWGYFLMEWLVPRKRRA